MVFHGTTPRDIALRHVIVWVLCLSDRDHLPSRLPFNISARRLAHMYRCYNWKYFYRNRMSTACDWKTLFKQDVFIYTSVLRLLCWKDKLNTRMQTSCKVILLKSSRHFMKTWLQLIFLYFVWPNKKLNNSTDKDVDDFHQNRKRLFVKYLLPFKGRKTKTRKFSEFAL